MSRWWSQRRSAAAWRSHSCTQPYRRSFSKGRPPAPYRCRCSSLIIGDEFQEHWGESGKVSPRNVSLVWDPFCCGRSECPSASRARPWRLLVLLRFQPGHGAGHTRPLRFVSREDVKYQRCCSGSSPPPITRHISPLPLCCFNLQINLSSGRLSIDVLTLACRRSWWGQLEIV